jgi:hypothetical protein
MRSRIHSPQSASLLSLVLISLLRLKLLTMRAVLQEASVNTPHCRNATSERQAVLLSDDDNDFNIPEHPQARRHPGLFRSEPRQPQRKLPLVLHVHIVYFLFQWLSILYLHALPPCSKYIHPEEYRL